MAINRKFFDIRKILLSLAGQHSLLTAWWIDSLCSQIAPTPSNNLLSSHWPSRSSSAAAAPRAARQKPRTSQRATWKKKPLCSWRFQWSPSLFWTRQPSNPRRTSAHRSCTRSGLCWVVPGRVRERRSSSGTLYWIGPCLPWFFPPRRSFLPVCEHSRASLEEFCSGV